MHSNKKKSRVGLQEVNGSWCGHHIKEGLRRLDKNNSWFITLWTGKKDCLSDVHWWIVHKQTDTQWHSPVFVQRASGIRFLPLFTNAVASVVMWAPVQVCSLFGHLCWISRSSAETTKLCVWRNGVKPGHRTPLIHPIHKTIWNTSAEK